MINCSFMSADNSDLSGKDFIVPSKESVLTSIQESSFYA